MGFLFQILLVLKLHHNENGLHINRLYSPIIKQWPRKVSTGKWEKELKYVKHMSQLTIINITIMYCKLVEIKLKDKSKIKCQVFEIQRYRAVKSKRMLTNVVV